LRFDPSFRSLRDLIVFVAVVGVGAIAIAALYVAAHNAAGHFTGSDFAAHTVYFWVGDVIGIVTTTPFLLIHGQRLARGQRARLTLEPVLQALAIAAVLALIYQLEPQRAANFFYLMFMPLVWISTRYGFEGATAGILAIQLGLIAVLNLADYPAEWVLQFELEMVALAVTGAFLGMTSTQWRRAREALENSEVELKTIVATAPDAIVSLDERCNVIDANTAAEGMFGMSAAELKRQTLSRLIENPPPDVSTAKAVPAHARRRDGHVFPVEVSFGSGMVNGRRLHIGVIRDMAERKEMEEKLRERDRHLDRTLRVAAAAEMASALAHELNQPLTAASAYVQSLELLLARHDKHDADLADAMHKTVSEVGRAGSIVRRLREFYRRDSGNLEAVPVVLLIDNALAPLRSRMDRHRITVEVSIEPDTPALLVDRVQMEMVLHNVLRNAVDSLAESGADVRRIEVSARAGQPGFVTLGVEDTGPGVSPAIAEQIFSSFVTSRNEGTGLGLAISRSIVERHGGRLWLDKTSSGARFMITLPAAKA
jgi:two-component system sensor kinase FixL